MRNILLRLRLDAQQTQENVAESLGISQQAYQMIETGKRQPKMALAKKIADHFGKTVDEIFFSENNNVTLS